LREQLGDPDSFGRADWRTAAGRAAGQAQIDAELGAVVSRHKADDLVARISRAVPVAVAYPPEELVVDDRRLDPVYLSEVDHPLWGKRRLLGLAWTFAGRGPVSLTAPPPLGNARTAASSWARELTDAVPGLEPSTSA
jgi:crotonobetainyl-CoA:carnitine CoA-transferase CaiB-like acyl-CoA transferase